MGFLPQPSERQAHKRAPTTAILNVGISAQVFLVDTIIVRACSWICILQETISGVSKTKPSLPQMESWERKRGHVLIPWEIQDRDFSESDLK